MKKPTEDRPEPEQAKDDDLKKRLKAFEGAWNAIKELSKESQENVIATVITFGKLDHRNIAAWLRCGYYP